MAEFAALSVHVRDRAFFDNPLLILPEPDSRSFRIDRAVGRVIPILAERTGFHAMRV